MGDSGWVEDVGTLFFQEKKMKKFIGVVCLIAVLTGCGKQIPCDDPEVMKTINSRITTTLDNRAIFLASYLAGNDYRDRKLLGTEDFDKYIARLSKAYRPERFR
ncbi:hypothetical protein NB640_04535 [Oxalobacter vibrioformis]|uniref:Uncharacterized protein n=1 Tax=Oxalobacter vibrioformis TaxID=933080 RepID=A0A9E9M0H6_9BURK|nr:hypothetical protein [Oxalobacter vibrioformis]WAW10912.1 hypothetical protein NB640_04535 [Oxalobacter vibrioformis]